MLVPRNILSPLKARLRFVPGLGGPSASEYETAVYCATENLKRIQGWMESYAALEERLEQERRVSLAAMRTAETLCSGILKMDVDDAERVEELRSAFRDLIALREEEVV